MSDGNIIACHAKDIEISSLAIPDKKSNSYIEDTLIKYYCGEGYTPSRPKVNYPYSGDPYVLIDSSDVKKWETIDKFIQ